MYSNFGIEARHGDPFTDLLDLEELKDLARRMRADIAAQAREGSPHREFFACTVHSLSLELTHRGRGSRGLTVPGDELLVAR